MKNDDCEFSVYKKAILNQRLLETQLFVEFSKPSNPLPNSYTLVISINEGDISYTLYYCLKTTFEKIQHHGFDIFSMFPMCVKALNELLFDDNINLNPNKALLEAVIKIRACSQLDKIKDLIYKIVTESSGNYNWGSKVGINNMNLGPELLSSDFSSCRGVLALLENGECALYHVQYVVDPEGLDKFISLIKDKVSKIYVFQKYSDNQSVNYRMKAPIIAINLRSRLPQEVEIKMVETTGYYHILCKAKEKKVYLITDYSNGIKYQLSDEEEIILCSETVDNCDIELKSIESCVLELFDNYPFKLAHGRVVFDAFCDISGQLIFDTAKFVLNMKKNKTSLFFDYKKSNLNESLKSVERSIQIIFELGLKKEVPDKQEAQKCKKKCRLQ